MGRLRVQKTVHCFEGNTEPLSEPDGLEIEEAPSTTGQQQSAMSRSWSF